MFYKIMGSQDQAVVVVLLMMTVSLSNQNLWILAVLLWKELLGEGTYSFMISSLLGRLIPNSSLSIFIVFI